MIEERYPHCSAILIKLREIDSPSNRIPETKRQEIRNLLDLAKSNEVADYVICPKCLLKSEDLGEIIFTEYDS